MAGRVSISQVTAKQLDLPAHLAGVSDVAAGATVSFSGVVRDHDDGRSVTELEYHEHPTAGSVVAEVAAEIAARDGVIAVAVSHRIGLLRVGDVALAAAVSAAHRREAFEVCHRLIDEFKATVPIWKHQTFTDGSDEWVGLP